jgi:hypothetical protein
MKTGYTHIAALIDASGSMQKVQQDTLGGFANFLAEQRKVPGECSITLATFNDHYHLVYSDVPLAHVADLTAETYKCVGWTSLNDSLAKLILEVGHKLAAKPEHERPSKVIIVILTDGQENASKEYVGAAGLKALADMVSHQTTKYQWSFCFLGANLDSFSVAQSYGFNATSTINYASNSVGTSNAFKSISKGVAGARITSMTGEVMVGGFFENELNKNVVAHDSLDVSNINETINKYTGTTTTTPKDTSSTPPTK